MGIFKNCFGDASALVQRSAFDALRGFTEDAGVGLTLTLTRTLT